MRIILMHPRWLQDRRLTLGPRFLAVGVLALLAVIASGAVLLSALMLHYRAGIRIPFLQQASSSVKPGQQGGSSHPIRADMALMMLKLGDMQARMMRLDSLGQRVQHLAGISPETFNFNETPGRGGYQRIASYRTGDMNLSELQQAMDALATDLEHRADYLNAVEAALMDQNEGRAKLSFAHPVGSAINASPFGLRVDPFTGQAAFHEGLDFAAPEGTHILAAGGGVVVAAGQHEQYGYMLDVSHGNDVMTRYAHASRLRVRLGDIIRRGQHIADVGSTGRSTGAHLHFEVQVGGIAQDPTVFLAAGSDPVKLASKDAN